MASQVWTETVPSNELSENQIDVLQREGFTRGLAKSLAANCTEFPIRFWVVDNSYSMEARDGHKIIDTKNHADVRTTSCTRWEEIKECVSYHARMSQLLGSETHFRLLNDPECVPQNVIIGGNNNSTHSQLESNLSKTKPMGLTPLTAHIHELEQTIRSMAPSMTHNGQKAVIVLATDGLPVSGKRSSKEEDTKEFVHAMRSLEGLPVWIVIRLCTDEEDVVDFYGDLDDQLELSLDVLDDFEGEAKEVYEFNKWLTYGLPIHRMRERGFQDRVFDLIDERALTKGELRQFFVLLFGEESFDGVPDPSVDWNGFAEEIERMLEREECQWNPVKKRVLPWVDMKELNKAYGDSHDGLLKRMGKSFRLRRR
uniref:VWFA domain-containing protein n=1 Tax=Helicotheca tamesis TaxID=374047 RepID=A0A6U0HYK7_9STRA